MFKKSFLLGSLFMLTLVVYAKDNFPEVYFNNEWIQGGVGQVFFYPLYGDEKIEVLLINKNQKVVATSKAFNYTFSNQEGGHKVAIALVGLIATMEAGNYTFKANMTRGDSQFSAQFPVEIEKRGYKKSTIKMGKVGTVIATGSRDPRRNLEAKTFYDALNSFDPNALYALGKLLIPIKRTGWKYSSVYGTQRTFIYENGKTGFDFHNGQDFANLPVGTSISAVQAGKVLLAEDRVVTGGTVIIEHLPGVFSLYYHMDTVTAKVGARVKQGDTIGTLGGKGFATGPHLHLTLMMSGKEVDPVLFFNKPLIDKEAILKQIKALKTTNSPNG